MTKTTISTNSSPKIELTNTPLVGVKKSEPKKEKNITSLLPKPTGWRILVMPYQGKSTTDKGLHIPDQIREREALATVVAYVLRIGPLAYQDPNKFGEEPQPWCEEGEWVCIGRYAGSRFRIEGGEVRIINDDEVIAKILEPDDIKHV